METLRLRQAVVAAADRDAVVEVWQHELGLGEPFADPGVEVFGLHNAVLPVGDTFLEVVSPLTPGDRCPAERYMAARGGDCGYMAIFQVADMDSARAHLAALGARSVFATDLDDIRCTHVHPADVGAAIVSFDQALPVGSWRWAGPGWGDQVRDDVVTGLAGLRLAAPDPAALRARWSALLAVAPSAPTAGADGADPTEPTDPAGTVLRLPDGTGIEVTEGPDEALVGIDLWAAPGTTPRSFTTAGTTFRTLTRVAGRDAAGSGATGAG
jgi:hypothetical protein